ncbi:uncharacterized protein FIBRA_01894 [Fibroporia radiculosa]|uniref:MIF4G domain-containing protein n=1 Tax=Fibroporia radiculosa TaxID=599839 RepID=J4H1I4_9APHY|nr:uncharacterized protein FIBRA_01894 [Fibroporia radiculosa]CCL99869.1 predicted protein [Fibroporia radiculosa]
MEAVQNGAVPARIDEEHARRQRRANMKVLNAAQAGQVSFKSLDSSLKRHTALIKRIRLSLAVENRDQIIKDIETLSLEKYVDELGGAVLEGIGRCKTEKDVWSAAEIISLLHRRFPKTFTPSLISSLSVAMAPPSRAVLSAMNPEQREKEETARVSRQRPVIRVCAELALVGIIKDGPDRSGGEWIMKAMKDVLSNDPNLYSLPLLSTFLKSFARPYLGLVPPSSAKQISTSSEPGTLSATTTGEANADVNGDFPTPVTEADELVEKEVRDRFKKMCEGYFDNVSKKLVNEHNRLQEQDRRNHEAYIRSGEIFEDRQQAYEKMTKSYEKLLASCQTLSELLYVPMPSLKTMTQKSESILIGTNTGLNTVGADAESVVGGKWEDEEERRFFEDVPDLKDYVPRSVLGVENGEIDMTEEEKEKREKEKEDMKKLEEELAGMNSKIEADAMTSANDGGASTKGVQDEEAEDDVPTPTPGTPKTSPPTTPQLAPQGPSQLLAALLARLPDATNRALIDQAAVDFAFLNSKAARKRLVKFMSQTPKNRTDLLPHYSRLVAILNKYMPDIGSEVVSVLDEEFRYLQRKKKVVNELAEVRLKNITFLSNLTKFRVVPPHLILHMLKVCLDDFSGTNVDNVALLLEGCGRFLLRSAETNEPFSKMLELMRRKQSLQHFDQRQQLLLENAYYQCNPPERAARHEKERTPMELFIRHLIYDVLTRKTIDKVLKLIRKLDWNDSTVLRTLHKVFTKPWKVKYGNVPLLAMLTYDLQRYHPAFAIAVVDQVLEDIRRGLEQNAYRINQRRVATVKYLGELYIYRLISSGIIFDTLWTFVTFGHPEGRPLPSQPSPIDMPDDFFRIRLVCVILDTCGMCFDRGTQLKKLDGFLTFFQLYVLCKASLPMDVEFMLTDSLEAVRPKLTMFKSFDEAVVAVDEMFNTVYQNAGVTAGEDSGEDSGEEGDGRRDEIDEDDDDQAQPESPVGERAPSPEAVVLKTAQETLGPSEEDDAEFAKEFAKLVTDTSAESRKVDKKTALALWESTVPPPVLRKRRNDDNDDDGEAAYTNGDDQPGVMTFTLFTKRGNKPQTRQLAIPSESALAVQTRTAQMQDKVEQQHLKKLVLDYEQREEAEELKALEARNRNGAIKIRYQHMQDTDDYFFDDFNIDDSVIAVLDEAENTYNESQRLTQASSIRNPDVPPPLKRQKLEVGWKPKPPRVSYTKSFEDLPEISVRGDGLYGLEDTGRRVSSTSLVPVPGASSNGRAFAKQAMISNVRSRSLIWKQRAVYQAGPSSAFHSPINAPTKGSGSSRLQPRRPPALGARNNALVEIQDASSVGQEVQAGLQSELEHLRSQFEQLKQEQELTRKYLKEAEDARFAKEGEVTILRKGIEKNAQEHAAEVARIRAAKEAAEALQQQIRKEAKEEMDRLKTQFTFKQHELETSGRSSPWSVRSKKINRQAPPTPVRMSSQMRQWNPRGTSGGANGLSQSNHPESDLFGALSQAIERSKTTIGRTQDKPKKTTTMPGFVNAFSSSPTQSQVSKGLKGKGKGRERSVFGRDTQEHDLFLRPALPQRRSPPPFLTSSPPCSPPSSPLPAGRSARRHVEGHGHEDELISLAPVPGPAPRDVEMLDETKDDEALIEEVEDIEPPDWTAEVRSSTSDFVCSTIERPPSHAQIQRLILTHRLPSSDALTVQLIISASLTNTAPPERIQEYNGLMTELFELLGTASTVLKDIDETSQSVLNTLVTMMDILQETSTLSPLTALVNLIRVLAISLPSFLRLVLSSSSNDVGDAPPLILVAICNMIRVHVVTIEDENDTRCALATEILGLLEVIAWKTPEELVHRRIIFHSTKSWSAVNIAGILPANVAATSFSADVGDPCIAHLLSMPLQSQLPSLQTDRQDLSGIPHIEAMALYLIDPTREGRDADALKEAILTFVASLSVAHADAATILTQSRTLIPSIICFLNQLVTPFYEEDYELMRSPTMLGSTVVTIIRTVSLFASLVFGAGNSALNLRQKILHAPYPQYHGLQHMLNVTLGRLCYAEPPHELSASLRNDLDQTMDMANQLFELVVAGPEHEMVWAAFQSQPDIDDDEEREARIQHPPMDDSE